MNGKNFIKADFPAHFSSAYKINIFQYPSGDAEATIVQVPRDKAFGNRRRTDKRRLDMSEENQIKCAKRARTNVRRTMMNGGVDRLLTLTYQENRTDLKACWKDFQKFIRLVRKELDKYFIYVAVPEFQKRGAVHFHLAIRGFYDVNALRRIWRGVIGAGGNIDISKSKNSKQNIIKLSQYLSKYITKAANIEFTQGSHRFRCSKGIKPIPLGAWMEPNPCVGYWAEDYFEMEVGQAVGDRYEPQELSYYFKWVTTWRLDGEKKKCRN